MKFITAKWKKEKNVQTNIWQNEKIATQTPACKSAY